MTRLRPLLVFVVVFACLAGIAGKRMWSPSVDNHYVHMAEGWLDGRLELPGKPPHRNDWGKVTTLELRDGRTLRGFPCKTTACRETTRADRVELWWTLGGEWLRVPRAEIESRTHTWYVTFPPGPAALFLPFVAIWGFGFLDVLFTALAGALTPAILVAFLDRVRGVDDGRGHQHLWLAAAWALGSPACFVAANGSVWLTGQTLGALFMTLTVTSAWDLKRPTQTGLWLALTMACRPPAALGAMVFVGIRWWREGRRRDALLRIALPVAAVGLAMAWMNWARFSSPFEFGHRYLDIAWQPRMQEHGMFSLHYLGRNLHCMFLLLPQMHPGALRWSAHGMSLLLAAPWLLAWPLGARSAFPQRRALVVAALVAALPGLLYQNTGQMQFTYRFAMDWMPLAVVGIAFGGGARRRWVHVLVLWAVALNIYGGWMFAHAPGRLFAAGLWPYGAN